MKNKMPFQVYIVWGTKGENVFSKSICHYEFDTEKELDAFLQGVDEANGWMDYEIVDKNGVAV